MAKRTPSKKAGKDTKGSALGVSFSDSNHALGIVSVGSNPHLIRVLAFAIAGILTALLLLTFQESSRSLEEQGASLGWSMFPDERPEERITIVAIDELSLSEVGPWPWSREVMAELVVELKEAGASLQIFDIVFPEAKDGDEQFIDVLTNASTVLGQVPILAADSPVQAGAMSGALEGMRCQPPMPSAQSYLANHSSFSGLSAGHITPIVESDGSIRRQPPLVCVQGRVFPSLPLQAFLQSFSQVTPVNGSLDLVRGQGLFSSAWYLKPSYYPGVSIPIDADGNMRISYRQHPDAFQVVSAVEVLNGTAPKSLLQGSWALVGATAFGLGDIVPTPHSGAAPGVELQARLLANLLDNTTPYSPAGKNLVLALECLFFSLVLFLIAAQNNRVSAAGLPIAAIVLPIAALVVHFQALNSNLWIGWLVPATYGLLAAALLLLVEHGRVRIEKQRVFNNLSSYLPQSVASEIAFRMPSGAVEVRRQEMVLLCADIRNFSTFAESRPPEEAAALLHCFFVKAADLIEQNHGQVEEFNGDSVLASWSVEEYSAHAADQALKVAHLLQSMISTVLPQPSKGVEPMALGVAVEKGSALVGSLGPANRRNHTLLGDTVTITLRIQEMTQELAQPILIGECAARDISTESLDSQGAFLLEGLRSPHVLFAPSVPNYDQDDDQDAEVANSLKVILGGKY